jgi:creatinine amidohydrolase/Fe(II)-dependent formamide hydrolase-like protein
MRANEPPGLSFEAMSKAALLLLLLLAPCTVIAQPASVFLEDFTWTEVRDATRAGKTTVIIPVGGTEQNGPHMVLGKHNVRVKFLAGRIAATLGNAIVAPVLAYVPEGSSAPPTAHMRFPGTITIPDSVLEEILESTGRGFRLHGFKDVVFIGDHGDYQKAMAKAAAVLNREWAKTSVRAHAVEDYYNAAAKDFPAYLKGKGFSAEEIGTHAGLADTSLALAVDASLVRPEQLKSPAGKADGVHGNPARATAELGRAGLDMIVERTVAAIRKATARR